MYFFWTGLLFELCRRTIYRWSKWNLSWSCISMLAKETGWSVTRLCRAYVHGADTWQTQNVMTNMRQMNEEAEMQFCEFNKLLGLARIKGQRDASVMERWAKLGLLKLKQRNGAKTNFSSFFRSLHLISQKYQLRELSTAQRRSFASAFLFLNISITFAVTSTHSFWNISVYIWIANVKVSISCRKGSWISLLLNISTGNEAGLNIFFFMCVMRTEHHIAKMLAYFFFSRAQTQCGTWSYTQTTHKYTN